MVQAIVTHPKLREALLSTGTSAEVLTYEQQFQALKELRKQARVLKEKGISLPNQKDLKEFLNQLETFTVTPLSAQQWVVTNDLKGSQYTVTEDFDTMVCDCPLPDGHCKHIQAVWDIITPQVIPQAPIVEQVQASTELPPTQEQVEVEGRRQLELLLGIDLRGQQYQALQGLIEFIGSSNRMAVLKGYAGSGKSFLLVAFIQLLRQQIGTFKIALTAPTNQAVKVLRQMAAVRGLTDVEFYTLHGLLGLKPAPWNSKNKEFQPDRNVKSSLNDFRLVVVDECSMVGDELYGYLLDELHYIGNNQILFVGDPAQARPVKGTGLSPTFSIEPSFELTEVVRYKGSIGVTATLIREFIDLKQFPRIQEDYTDDRSQGVFKLKREEWTRQLIRAFQSDAAYDSPNYVKALAYTNDRVKRINTQVRAAVLGDDIPQFVRGERLIAQEAYSIGNTGVLYTSEECYVLNAYEGESSGWKVWYLEIHPDEHGIVTVPVLQDCEIERFEQKLEQLAEFGDWQRYGFYRQLFADLRHCYAITTHKAQGSTYANVFIDLPDMLMMPKGRSSRERNELLYTAFTRASDRVFAVEGK